MGGPSVHCTVVSTPGMTGWYVQERPLLLPGRRKFDIRVWALAVESPEIPLHLYLYKQGVLRTGSVAYSLEDLQDKFVHLTNHSIQIEHDNFETHEQGNELFFDDFQSLLDQEGHDWQFNESGWAQIRETVEHSFRSSWEMIASSREYTSFQVFGYDFMIDEDYKVWLIEVNAAPCVTERLRSKFASELITLVVDPIYPKMQRSQDQDHKSHDQNSDAHDHETFELVYSLKA